MKLFPPQDYCKIYEEGFGSSDLFGRKPMGEQLSRLLERIDDPVVVAIDGPWGSGKSHFLKRWVGAHGPENGGRATTVYFDAFANDFLDDPLIGLTGVIAERLPQNVEKANFAQAKKAVVMLARPFARIAAAVTTAGISELSGPILDVAIEAGGKEVASAADAFWRREEGKRAAIFQFKEALTKITAPLSTDEDGKPLIIVVDELDRCRPDYALSMLEVIKHFFAVPRVHFVLGVNLDALEHMVRVRYGSGIDAHGYLKRFISLSMQLPSRVHGREDGEAPLIYFRELAPVMGLDARLSDVVGNHLRLLIATHRISLRDIEKILPRLALLPFNKGYSGYPWGVVELVISMLLMQVLKPVLYDAAVSGRLSIGDVDQFYGATPEMINAAREYEHGSGYNHSAYVIHNVWSTAIAGRPDREQDSGTFIGAFGDFWRGKNKKIVEIAERRFLATFKLPDS